MTGRKIDWRNPPFRPQTLFTFNFLPQTFSISPTMRPHLAASPWFCHSCPSLLKDIAEEKTGASYSSHKQLSIKESLECGHSNTAAGSVDQYNTILA